MTEQNAARPDTYFVQEAIDRGIDAIDARLDRNEGMRPFFELWVAPTPHMAHTIWDFGDMSARYTDALILGRQVTGNKNYPEDDDALRSVLAGSNPWDNPFMPGRMALSFLDQYLQEPSEEHRKRLDDLIAVTRAGLTFEDDYAYYFRHPKGWNTWDDAIFGAFEPYPTYPLGGLILALARYGEAGGSAESEDLLERLARFVLRESGTFREDGKYKGHTHSGGILTAATGLFRWAVRVGNTAVVQQMRNAFDWTVMNSSSWGWVPDGLGGRNAMCETCCITDAIHLGTLVARHIDPSYYGIVERYVRNQFMENQVTKTHLLLPKERTPEIDAIETALRGSWMSWARPNSFDDCLDVQTEGCCLGSGIRGMYLAWGNSIAKHGDKISVNMSFSRNSEWVEVIGYQPYEGRVDVIVHNAPKVEIRIPEWVSSKDLKVSLNGRAISAEVSASRYVQLEGLQPGDRISAEYPLRQEETTEKVNNLEFRGKWRGDTLVGIEPRGEIYPLFERDHYQGKAPMLPKQPYVNQKGGPVHW
jgi:hypothetical protein